MEENWKRIMAVVALSVLLPQLILHIGSKMYTGQALPEETLSTEETATQSQNTPVRITIPVLTDENVVVQMELEEYIRGVVLAEMPASFGVEALKAQAVAARTYAIRRVWLKDRHEEGAVCTDPGCCQAWLSDEYYLEERGTRLEWKRIRRAVAETAGQVVTYENTLAETTYFSCSGGRTESALDVWDADIPYLQAVDSPGEEWAAVFFQELFFSKEEFQACLGRDLTGDPEQWLGQVYQTDGGGVDVMVIGGISYSGVELRRMLGLPSTAFSMTAGKDGITISARGHGHRVGLSQYGAGAMAAEGFGYTQILQHYYPGTRIDKIEEIS